MPLTKQVAEQICNHFNIKSIYQNNTLYQLILDTDNKIDVLDYSYLVELQKSKKYSLLELYDFFQNNEFISISIDFKLTVKNFKHKPQKNSPFDEISTAIYTQKIKFCFLDCIKAFFKNQSDLDNACQQYSSVFPALDQKTVYKLGKPEEIKFQLYKIPIPGCKSIREFRKQNLGQFASILIQKDCWIVRPRKNFIGEILDDLQVQKTFFNSLYKESEKVIRLVDKNIKIKARKQNKVKNPLTSDKQKKQWVQKGTRLSAGQKRLESWKQRKQVK